MKLALLSTKNQEGKLVKARVINKNTLEVTELSHDSLIDLIKSTGIEGLSEDGGKITGTNGTIERYEYTSNKIVVLFRTSDGYILSNHDGSVIKRNESDTLILAQKFGVANGKLVKNNGKIYLSAINGTYDFIREAGIIDDTTRSKKINSEIRGKESKQTGNDSPGNLYTGRAQNIREGGQANNRQRHTESSILDGLTKLGYSQNVKADEFYGHIQLAKDSNTHGASVDTHSIKEYGEMNCITLDGGKAGVAVHNGDIISVFKHTESSINGAMKHLMTSAIISGGNKLDCYSIGGALPSLYTRYGFIPVCKIKFNREFAPDNWDYERDGEPNIVFMAYCGDNIENMRNKESEYKPYSDYTDNEVPYIYDTPDKCAYDIASELRDEHIQSASAPAPAPAPAPERKTGEWLAGAIGLKGFIKTIIRGRN